MRWCRFRDGDEAKVGVVEDDGVYSVDGSPFGAYRVTGERHEPATLRWLPPVVPSTFFAVGLNYTSHIEHARQHGMAAARVPDRPEIGYRANSALTGHLAPVVKPAGCTGRFETEGELVAVIGRRLRRCSREEAVDAVLGWTIGNDVSAREWQHADRTLWRAKNSDTFKPMGPWIETDVDPLQSTTTVEVNGEARAKFATGDMIFDPYDYLCEITRYITVSAGDVLWMGTDATVDMRPGDVVSVSISGVGTLTNPIEEER